MWDDLISLAEAAEEFKKGESTLRLNIRNGFFIEGVDCKKFGKQWVFSRKALEKKYQKNLKKND